MGISIWQLLIVLVIVLLLFGTKKLRNMGGDLGAAIRNFKGAVKEGGDEAKEAAETVSIEDDSEPTVDAATMSAKEGRKVCEGARKALDARLAPTFVLAPSPGRRGVSVRTPVPYPSIRPSRTLGASDRHALRVTYRLETRPNRSPCST